MHKAFRAIDREKGEDGRAFFARVFQEAGGSGDFREPWMKMSQVVDEGYESPYVFGRMMRQYLQDEHAVIYRYNPTRVYMAFNGGTDDTTRAVLYDPTWRTADEQPITAPPVDWFASVDDLTGLTPIEDDTPMRAKEPEPDDPLTYTCENCGRDVDAAEAYIEEGILCPDCWLDQYQVN